MSQRTTAFVFLRILIALGVLGGIAYFWWQKSRPWVKAVAVSRENAPNAVPGSVTVNAERSVIVRSAVGGLVAEGVLEVGKMIKKGDFLIKLDTSDLELEIAATQNTLATAEKRREVGSLIEIELKNSTSDLQNLERLLAEGKMSQLTVDRARSGVEAIQKRLQLETVDIEASIAALKNSLEVKKLRLQRMTVTSPVDGQISEVFAFPGDIIGNESPVVTIISATRTIDARISEENFSGIKVGDKASVRFLGYGEQLYGASVSKVLPTADPTTQRYIVYLNVDIDTAKLVPGLTGEVSIVVDEHLNTLVIPRRALFGGKVYVAKNGVVELRSVKLGFTSLNKVEVLEGLQEGEHVLVEELDMIKAGDRVRVQLEATSRSSRF
ncbi:MAG TPA: efflux RND transporter periplasmic adaptor subunit [Opitutaceae bacterium]|nr:efflux RND transporter periplasmic adaptor subunit [Opitutaceae bacterium]